MAFPTLTDIPDDFGTGGSGLTPKGQGSPTLATFLQEHKDGLDDHEDRLGVVEGLTTSPLSDAVPATPSGSASAGTSNEASRADHQHGDIGSAELDATFAALKVGSLLATATAEAGDSRTVTVQAKDCKGTNLAHQVLLRVTVQDAAYGALCAVAPNGNVGAPSAGTVLQTVVANKDFWMWTDSSGKVTFTVGETTAKTFHIGAACGDVATDLSLAFT